ncbi:hypothetical protein ACROYT_G033382 [Oculina patagonica]
MLFSVFYPQISHSTNANGIKASGFSVVSWTLDLHVKLKWTVPKTNVVRSCKAKLLKYAGRYDYMERYVILMKFPDCQKNASVNKD